MPKERVMNASPPVDPYRRLFFLGGIVGIIGASTWLAFASRLIAYYPRDAHANVMFFGLLWSFIAGFLMTAIPRMTQTPPAKDYERHLAMGLVVSQALLSILNLTSAAIYVFAIQTFLLASFMAIRAPYIKRLPFKGFVFLPMALFQAALGVFLFFHFEESSREPVTLLCQEAFVLNLILGLGSRLIPALSRIPKATLPNQIQLSESWAASFFAALGLNVTYWVQLLGWPSIGLQVRSVLVIILCVWLLKWFHRPTQWTPMGIGLKIATSCLALGLILRSIDSIPAIASIHVLYIGGFALITFLVSTRVILAHGGQDLSYELSSKKLGMMVALVTLAAALRFMSPEITGPFIYLSSTLFIGAIAIWIMKFTQVEISRSRER